MKLKKLITCAMLVLAVCMLQSCKDKGKTEGSAAVDPKEDIGVGPISSIEIGALDEKLATEGEEIFKAKCTACHKVGKRYVGPDVVGVTERRRPEWIMNMILDPVRMVNENAEAKKLLMEYNAPMANQSLSEKEARSILEYFRKLDSK